MGRVTAAGLDETHDPALKSWVGSANAAETDFPIQNLPFGLFSTASDKRKRIGVAIGEEILDLDAAIMHGALPALPSAVTSACAQDALNDLMALDKAHVKTLRLALSGVLRAGSKQAQQAAQCLVPQRDAVMHLPARIGNYTDFFTSIYHARNTGRMVRPANPLLPNFHTLPVAYHGRASSIRVSGTPCIRPHGQILRHGSEKPVYAPTEKLDFELELGVFVGQGNALGTPISIEEAEQHIFGFCLLNDWSSRDVQRWEAQPLGPFLAKSFLSSVSPWVITMEALAPFRSPAAKRDQDAAALVSNLDARANQDAGGIDISLEVILRTERMRANKREHTISRPAYKDQYWTVAQMITHHTENGCPLLPGDLLGSGTVSGPSDKDLGCLLELTMDGKEPLSLPEDEVRAYLEDGDEIILKGRCQREGYVDIGFGECTGQVVARQN
ncbi:fumarylacetoacetase [Pusillimonas sp. SM2304]|uniref:fumarylacetoacetase n=1 Tax=Pusillimonas sp. SM2304 TaxID=3073241 RepID=UPI002876F1F2|nr:fumarylacetoacetase [Pusillimonas sp. SM2304]MDS1139012.1 fumarylacetoacetase [Pusillimonas sp. SM2304]